MSIPKIKYPRTPHLPFSPGFTGDDVHSACEGLIGKHVVATVKMDGECTSLYPDGSMHARSIDSRNHSSRNWVKEFWARHERAYSLDEGWRVCGENLYAAHSLKYDNLKSFFYGFSAWNKANTCLSWADTVLLFKKLKIEPVEVLWIGEFDLKKLKLLAQTLDTNVVEGFVVRLADSFQFEDFNQSVAKWVRKNHVATNEHWMQQAIVANKLA